jgi:hypothetical protein
MCFYMLQRLHERCGCCDCKETYNCREASLGMNQLQCFVLAFGCIEQSIAAQHGHGVARRTHASMSLRPYYVNSATTSLIWQGSLILIKTVANTPQFSDQFQN